MHQRLRIVAVFVAVLVGWTAIPGGVEVAEAAVVAGGEQAMVDHVNRERAAAGLPGLTVNLRAARIAREWSAVMGRDGHLRHNEGLRAQVSGPWQRLGENVGRTRQSGASEGQLVERLHAAFMNSSGHRENILRSSFNQVGVGLTVAPDGTMWAAVVFVAGPVGQFPLFDDAAASTHLAAIERLWRSGVTTGCSFAGFCPEMAVTRAQMASFLSRAIGLAPVDGSRFSDVPAGAAHAGSINALAAAGVTDGCGDDRFCPERPLSRAEMASFLARALELAPGQPAFRDVAQDHTHAGAIAAVADAGITSGCGDGGDFCPEQSLIRAQMATFMAKALDHGFPRR